MAIGAVLSAVLVALGTLVTSGPAPAPPSRPLGPPKTPADLAARAMPPGEASFIAAIEQGRAAGATDAARATRAAEICRVVPNPHVFAWSGVVEAVSSEGAPFVAIAIAPDIHLTTRGDNAAESAIDPHVLPSLSTLQPGQAVAFSGMFAPSRPGDGDCYRQMVAAPDGAMAAPVFVVWFSSIAPFKAAVMGAPGK